MPGRDIIVIGFSAGGVAERGSDVIRQLLLAGSAAPPEPVDAEMANDPLPDLATTERG
ncbi:MAG: hypothetical protein ABI703_03020 [Gemmatimonadales bacterium]